MTLLSLLMLAGISLALRYAHLGSAGLLAAMLIAVSKAALVVVFFMEILTEKATARLIIAAGLTLFALLLVLLTADIVTRAPSPLANPPGTALRERG